MDLRQRLADLAISASGFVFDPYTGTSFTVNATGMRVLEALKSGAPTREALMKDLTDHFDVHGEDVQRDLDEFIALLRRFDLLPRDFTLEPA